MWKRFIAEQQLKMAEKSAKRAEEAWTTAATTESVEKNIECIRIIKIELTRAITFGENVLKEYPDVLDKENLFKLKKNLENMKENLMYINNLGQLEN